MWDQAWMWFNAMDQHLLQWCQQLGGWSYVVLALIIFGESGIVLLPFLPGDSLLFTAGSVTGMVNSPIQVWVLMLCLIPAAFLGNLLNYALGYYFFYHRITQMNSRWINPEHVAQAQAFYHRYGPIAILLGRFVPFVRTFAPFVAGTIAMPFRIYVWYSALGAFVWIGSLVMAGHWFGQIPWVQERLHWMVVAVLLICLLPLIGRSVKAIWGAKKQ